MRIFPLVIAIAGLHGTGKSTYAKAIAERFGLRHISAGQIFRQIAKERQLDLDGLTKQATDDPIIDKAVDERIKEEAEMGNVVIDGQLSAWMTRGKSSLKVFLTAPEDVRISRISRRDGVAEDEARRQTLMREESERDRYKRYYGVDVADLSVYDMVVDTSLYSEEETKMIIVSALEELIQSKKLR